MKIVKKIESVIKLILLMLLIIYINVGTVLVINKHIDYLVFSKILSLFGITFFVVYIIDKIINKENIKLKDIIIVLLGIFGYISYKYAYDPQTALYGVTGRNEGLFVLLTYYMIFLISTTIPAKHRKIIMAIFIITGLFQIVLGTIQTLRITNILGYDRTYNYSAKYKCASGTLGNPNFYSAYILMCLVYVYSTLLKQKRKLCVVLYLLLTIVFLYGLIIGNTLGCLLSFGIIFLIITTNFIFKGNVKKKISMISIIIIILSIITSNLNIEIKQKITKIVSEGYYEIKTIFSEGIKDSTGNNRIYVWKETIKNMPENIWNGIGIDNFHYINDGTYICAYLNNKLQCFDKAHNEFLHKLATEGIFSFVLYLTLLTYIIIYYIKNPKQDKTELFIVFIAYVIQSTVGLSVIMVAPIYYMIMGFIIYDKKKEMNQMIENDEIIKVENLKFSKNTFNIRWNITRLCNYYCDFCIQGNKEKHLEDSKNESLKLRREICDKIIEFIETKVNKKYTKLKVYLIGGEVTLLKDFIEILEKIINCKFEGELRISITTNLSTDNRILEKIKNIADSNKDRKYPRTIHITASYYNQFTTEKEFINKIKILNGNPIQFIWTKIKNKFGKKSNLNIHISYPLITDKDYKKYLKFRIKYFLNVDSIRYIYILNYKKEISQKLKNKLSKTKYPRIKVTLKNGNICHCASTSQIGFIIKDTHKFNPNKLLCDVGVYNIFIDNIGMVSKCSTCAKTTEIGNILEKELDIISEPAYCTSMKCGCDYYHSLERKKYEEKQ